MAEKNILQGKIINIEVGPIWHKTSG